MWYGEGGADVRNGVLANALNDSVYVRQEGLMMRTCSPR